MSFPYTGRREDQRLLTGQGRYTADWNRAHQLHAALNQAAETVQAVSIGNRDFAPAVEVFAVLAVDGQHAVMQVDIPLAQRAQLIRTKPGVQRHQRVPVDDLALRYLFGRGEKAVLLVVAESLGNLKLRLLQRHVQAFVRRSPGASGDHHPTQQTQLIVDFGCSGEALERASLFAFAQGTEEAVAVGAGLLVAGQMADVDLIQSQLAEELVQRGEHVGHVLQRPGR